MIKNPILPGFNPDPCICRKGEDYYIAVSSFEWFPGIPIYHSRDLEHWALYAHALQNADDPDLKKLPSAKGSASPRCSTNLTSAPYDSAFSFAWASICSVTSIAVTS